MPDLSSNLPGPEPDLPDFLDESVEAGDFLGLGASPTDSPAPPKAEFEAPEPQALEALTEVSEPEATPESADQVPAWALDEEEEEDGTMSWLMEFENGEELSDEDPNFHQGEDYAGGAESEYATEMDGEGNAWMMRAAIAGVSLGLGFAGARFFAERGAGESTPNTSTPTTIVAQADPQPSSAAAVENNAATITQPITPPAQPRVVVELGPLPNSGELEGPWRPEPSIAPVVELTPTSAETVPEIDGVGAPINEPPAGNDVTSQPVATHTMPQPRPETGRNPLVRLTGPSRNPYMSVLPPFMTLDGSHSAGHGALELSPMSNGPSVTVSQSTGNGTTSATDPSGAVNRIIRNQDPSLSAEDLGNNLREASAAELSGLWVGGSIPMNRIEDDTKLMTPGVGRVRVLLTAGEIFEGDLYAIGESKVWIQTELGKMALLAWQVERIEHVLDSSSLTNPDAAASGLASVRVRTPGGVFYGRLVRQTEDSVTLLTADGARLTLHDAEIDSAGRSATHLVDSTGMLPEEPQEPKKE